jgi:alcohol dehydrogenase
VRQIGEGVSGFAEGQPVVSMMMQGSHAELASVPARKTWLLPDSISFEQGARFGYLGTSYSALRKAQFSPGQTVLIDGATGTLGLGAVILALAMGAAKVFATGRNKTLLDKLQNLDAQRIVPIALGTRPTAEIVMEATDGYGVDVLIEALGPNAPVATVLDSFNALRRGGKAINIGGVADPIPLEPFPLMCLQKSYIGSLWFTTAEGQDMADMAHSGTLNLGVFEHERDGYENQQPVDGRFHVVFVSTSGGGAPSATHDFPSV